MTALVDVKRAQTLILARQDEIKKALPRFMRSEYFVRVVLTEIATNPALLECDQASVIQSVMKGAELGLAIGSTLGQAYLVPFFNKKSGQKECTLIPGYKGLVALVRRSGEVSTFYAQCVYKGDEFRYTLGTSPKVDHVPSPDATQEITHVYAVCVFKDGGHQFEVMTRQQVDDHRDRYSKQSNFGPWKDSYGEMAKKTVIRRIVKMLPVTIEMDFGDEPDEDSPQYANTEKFREISAAPDLPKDGEREVYLAQIETLAEKKGEAALKIVPADYKELSVEKLIAIVAQLK